MDEDTYRLVSLIVQCLGFVGAIVTLIFLWQQLRNTVKALKYSASAIEINTKAIEQNAFNSAASNLMEIGKLFVDKPHLRKYFYDGEPVPERPEEYEQAKAAALVMLDFLANILVYVNNYEHLYPEKEWHGYIKDIFRSSPMLRETFTQLRRAGKEWYVEELYRLMLEAVHQQRAPENVQTSPDRR
jgi:hypothetical protein